MVLDKVKEILAEYTDADITLETAFDDLGIDSLDMLDMVMKVEEELGVQIELNPSITTVGALIELIESK
ncbi:MAG: acyl carrier protein [Oscillospiraceae bacterium]|nr:acyl carrier protein [Oscillospiraceae bacterium]